MVANLKVPAILLASLISLSAVAEEELPDPTRPVFERVFAVEKGAASASVAPQGLQSVILSDRREAAIINGTEVEVGQKYGDSVLTVVNETCVVLAGPQGRRVLHLFPTVNLSKTQLACTGRNALLPIRKASSKRVAKTEVNDASVAKTTPAPVPRKRISKKKKPVRKRINTCGCDEIKNGSLK